MFLKYHGCQHWTRQQPFRLTPATQDESGRTPLQLATRSPSSLGVISALFAGEKTPDINRVAAKETVLSYGCKNEDMGTETIQYLLDNGACLDPQKTDMSISMSPLVALVECGATYAVQTLLDAGADINAPTNISNNTALQYAVWKYSLAASGDDSTDVEKYEQCIRTLLEYRPELDSVDRERDSALHNIRRSTPITGIRLLLRAGANPDLVNDDGQTPLTLAINRDNYPLAELYVSFGRADVNAVSHSQRGGPLHIACGDAKLNFVKLLVTHSASVNKYGGDAVGIPLQAACLRSDVNGEQQREVLTYLLENEHARANIYNEGGPYGHVFNLACLKSETQTMRLLLNSGGDRVLSASDYLNRNPAHLVSLRTLEQVAFVAEHHTGLFLEQDSLGRRALHYAVGSGRLEVVEKVLVVSTQVGVGVDSKDWDGWTPLMWAARCGNGSEDVPWLSQAELRGKDQAAIIRFLIREGADVWLQSDFYGRRWTPLSLAHYHGAGEEILELLRPARCTHPSCDNRKLRTAETCLRHTGDESANAEDREGESATSADLGAEEWDEEARGMRMAKLRQNKYCRGCLFMMCGTYFQCIKCPDYFICFKCYPHLGIIHPAAHQFRTFDHDFVDEQSDESEEMYSDDEGETGRDE